MQLGPAASLRFDRVPNLLLDLQIEYRNAGGGLGFRNTVARYIGQFYSGFSTKHEAT